MKTKIIKGISVLCILGLVFGLVICLNSKTVKAIEEAKDIIGLTEESEWFHNPKTESQGTWSTTSSKVTLDSFGGAYAIDGANLISTKAIALGAYEFETKIVIKELNKVQNPMVGIIPWYVDENNYIYIQLKFTNSATYLLSAGEKADGYAIEQIIVSGRYDGESKYVTATTQQENTVFDSIQTSALSSAKVNPLNEDGHTLKVKFENNSSTATSYKLSISYNGKDIGSTYAYFYNAVPRINSVGFMGQDVKAEFTDAKLTDFYATNNTVALARDYKENNGFIYKVLNGNDVWKFNSDESISFTADEVKEGNKVVSRYKVSGTNIAGYDTNRGYTTNQYKETAEGLPQNYRISSLLKMNEVTEYKGSTLVQGYGLLAWYKDDQNFVDVTIRRSISGLALAPKIKNEIVLFGWIDCSSADIGENVYELPDDFDFSKDHKLTVEKKSTGFYVYLDEETTPIISKSIKGTNLNYYYGYEGYNTKFSASKISATPIYSSYDEVTVLDNNSLEWRSSAKAKDSWKFSESSISINAKEEKGVKTNRSYILTASDVSDMNMTVEAIMSITLGESDYSEVMLSPYVLDNNNYARVGLSWKNNKLYAYLKVSTYTEEDMDNEASPHITQLETEINQVDLSKPIKIKAEKVNTTLALYVNGTLVYGKVVEDIDYASEDYGIYVYNLEANITSLKTFGYKKYTESTVGDFITAGMKYNSWTIDKDGYLAGDATYTKEMGKDEDDSIKNYAIKENTLRNNYKMTVDIIATAQSETEDRVGVVMWYLDEDNFMIFYMDRWRSDSTVPRTTVYGVLGGETLPVTYNHGGWLAESDNLVGETGKTQTELSQVTEWHTITVIKEGNTFTCYIDNETNGYISYTVEAGLPSIEDKTLYSGIYSYNDAVLVRRYDVCASNETPSNTLPAAKDNPISDEVKAPTLSSYNEKEATDYFDGGFVVDPGKEDPTVIPTTKVAEPTTVPKQEEPVEKKGCGSVVQSLFLLPVVLATACITFTIKKKKEEI